MTLQVLLSVNTYLFLRFLLASIANNPDDPVNIEVKRPKFDKLPVNGILLCFFGIAFFTVTVMVLFVEELFLIRVLHGN